MTEDYSEYDPEELERQCDEVSCCRIMAENLFNGDIRVRNGTLGISLNGSSVDIRYCPWCSKIVTRMETFSEFISYIYEKRKTEYDEEIQSD